jgi:protein arginine N-methyltransferase 2
MAAPGPQLLASAAAGDAAGCSALLEAGACEASFQEEEEGRSALMVAAGAGHAPVVSLLLNAGAAWNALDRYGRCAGNYALDAGHQAIVDELVEHATRCELLLGASERRTREGNADGDEYLRRSVVHQGDRADGEALLDEAGDAVMMEWEAPVMQLHAAQMCEAGGDVLNVGFGLGIIDSAIHARHPRSHAIIEAHPEVHARMMAAGWGARQGVRVHYGRWQEVLPTLPDASLDAIFFDTYAEHDAEMSAFHQHLPRLLRPGGVYSFFNGFCPRNVFLQGVACAVVQLELHALGFGCEFRPVVLPGGAVNGEGWAGVRRPYFYSETYYLPHCVLGGVGAGRGAYAAVPPGEAEGSARGDGAGMVDAARRLVQLNDSLMSILVASLYPCAPTDAAQAATQGSSGLRAVISEQVLPHLEQAGWRLTDGLTAMWAASDCGASIHTSDALWGEIDSNSAEVLRRVVALHAAGADGLPVAELRLAILPNPLAEGHMEDLLDSCSASGANSDGAEGKAVEGVGAREDASDGTMGCGSGVCRFIDGREVRYGNADEFWNAIGRGGGAGSSAGRGDGSAAGGGAASAGGVGAGSSTGGSSTAAGGGIGSAAGGAEGERGGEGYAALAGASAGTLTGAPTGAPSGDAMASVGRDGWYGSSVAHWASQPATVPSMLGGLEELDAADVSASLGLIDTLRASPARPLPHTGVALDCGSGIGRVSAAVLLKRFSAVDLVDPIPSFLQQAKAALPRGSVRHVSAVGLQDWRPPSANDRYPLVWVQWVLLYLTDDDSVAFLRLAALSLAPEGYIVVKESVAKASRGWRAEEADGSLTRTHAHFEALFRCAGLAVAHCAPQHGLPREVYAVNTYALVLVSPGLATA